MEHTFNLRQISKKKKRKKKEKKNRKKERKEGRKEEREREKERKVFSKKKKKKKSVRAVVAHAFNPSIREAEADRLMCSRPAWSTQ